MRSSLLRALCQTVLCGVLVAGVLVLQACNTVKGAGQDIQNAGESGERAIDNATK